MERRKRNVDRIVTKLGMILTDNGSKYRIIDIYLYLGGNEKGGNEWRILKIKIIKEECLDWMEGWKCIKLEK